ncbi:MAG: hypothetical protein CMO01_12260 [Thalassobius sp.]|nr:hypothetical protein [Thalassovita sp.]
MWSLVKSSQTYLVLTALILTVQFSYAQKAKLVNVSGSAEIRMEEANCIGEAKQRVIDAARINALEKVFGRVIVQGTNTYIENIQSGDRVQTNTQMNTIGNSMVKGEIVEMEIEKLEWITRDQENTTGISNELWLFCEIKGKAREISEAETAFEIFPMNCITENCVTSNFHNRDRMYFNFRTPVKGYLSIYMEDNEDGRVYRLFPYSKMNGDMENAVPVKSDVEYILFSEDHHKNYFPDLSRSIVDPIVAYTTKEKLFNRVFVIFSEEEYKKPILEVNPEAGGIKTIDPDRFHKWISQNERNPKFQVSNLDITISK